ncbi:unnamed protein product [Prorocentrum cordatum]|uniref:RanBD1 domain-containing protein n=1 Tax=Prorocentrum cordatum TaxID=2364126 RepID=A0ABN9T3T3_9DINO|nr:unnamed protein product [Polarella glacialis]
MERGALEALSNAQLRRLIAEAAALLEERASAVTPAAAGVAAGAAVEAAEAAALELERASAAAAAEEAAILESAAGGAAGAAAGSPDEAVVLESERAPAAAAAERAASLESERCSKAAAAAAGGAAFASAGGPREAAAGGVGEAGATAGIAAAASSSASVALALDGPAANGGAALAASAFALGAGFAGAGPGVPLGSGVAIDEAPPAPIFASFSSYAGGGAPQGSLFGGCGASGGTLAAAMRTTGSGGADGAEPTLGPRQEEDLLKEGEVEDEEEEEEVTAVPGWVPSIQLEVIDGIATGDEDEDELYSQRSKLYRFKNGEWKERGLGDARLLRHFASGRVRFLMRQEKTGKIVANHHVVDDGSCCDLRPHTSSDKCLVWSAPDFADGALAVEILALRFRTAELAGRFGEAWSAAKRNNAEAAAEGLAGAAAEGAAPSTCARSLGSAGGGAEPGAPVSSAGDTVEADAEARHVGVPVDPQAEADGFGHWKAPAPAAGGAGEGAPPTAEGPPAVTGEPRAPGPGAAADGLFAPPARGSGTPRPPPIGEHQPCGCTDPGQAVAAESGQAAVLAGGFRWAPSILLEVLGGDGDEEQLYRQYAKLYKLHGSQWQDCGTGDAMLLRRWSSGRIRFLMRQAKTATVMSNHYVVGTPYCDLSPNAGSEKCWAGSGAPRTVQAARSWWSSWR